MFGRAVHDRLLKSTASVLRRTGRRRARPCRVAPPAPPVIGCRPPRPGGYLRLQDRPRVAPTGASHNPPRSDSEAITTPMTNTTKTESPSTYAAGAESRAPAGSPGGAGMERKWWTLLAVCVGTLL